MKTAEIGAEETRHALWENRPRPRAGEFVWTAESNGEVHDDCPTWREFTGQTLEQLQGFGWLDALHPEDRARTRERWAHVVAAGSIYESHFRVRRVDGQWRHLDVRGVPVWENGEIRKWVGFCRDVSERINYLELLTRERDFSDAVIESLPGVFYLTDEADKIVRVNRYAEVVCGYSVDEICGQHGNQFVPPEQREPVRAARRKLIEHGDNLEMELEIVSKTGKHIPLFVNGARFFIDGKPCVIGVGLDISRLKEAEQALRELNVTLEGRVRERTRQLEDSNRQLEESNRQLAESNKQLEAFSYTVSHDLRAPLHAIRGFAEIVAEDYATELKGDGLELMRRIAEAGERMTRLMDDVLRYSRTGRTAVKLTSVPMTSLIQQVKTDFELQLKQIGCEPEIVDDLPAVQGDPTLLAQVFSNLFQNAINYRRKEVPLTLKVRARREQNEVVFSVSDNGEGIAPEYHEKVFQAFQRLHTDQECAGSGLGLATVKKAVETMGGNIWLESQVGRGTTFFIRLKEG